jgi:hypothetical protein
MPKSLNSRRMAVLLREAAARECVGGSDNPSTNFIDPRLALEVPSPAHHGEVVEAAEAHEPEKREWIRDTLERPNRVTQAASVRRTNLLLQDAFDCVALGVDAADSIDAKNSLEKMLAHQMAVAHEASMRIMNRAMQFARNSELSHAEVEQIGRLTNAGARMMRAYQEGLLALQKIRTGGKQVVVVKRVDIRDGGQAVIGNVDAGGTTPNAGKPHAQATRSAG